MKPHMDSIIGDILDADSSCENIFLEYDMHCTDCPSARGETLEEACSIHGVEPEEILRRLRERMGQL